MRDMTDKETAEHIRQWANQTHGLFAWPTDGCGYDQHIKFVNHRNANYDHIQTMTQVEWKQFLLDYADSLDGGTGAVSQTDKEQEDGR